MPTRTHKGVFLDRDGILNDDVGFPHRIGDAELLPDVIPSLLRLQAAGIKLVVVSNQSGIARGYFSAEVAVAHMQTLLDDTEALYRAGMKSEADVALDSVFRIGNEAGFINEFFVDVLSYDYFDESDEQILYAVLNKKVECYERVLELDPENRNAAKWIERLRKD